MKFRRRVLLLGWLLAVLLGAGVCRAPHWRPWESLSTALTSVELYSYDHRLGWRPRRAPDPRIAIIAIDVESLEEFGAMPWDRRVHAQLLDRLRQGGAGAVALDIAFSGVRESTLGGEPQGSGQDRALVESLRAFPKVVVARYVDVIQRYDAQTGEPHIERRIHTLPQGMVDALGGKRGIGLAFCETDADHSVRTTWVRVSPQAFGLPGEGGDGLERTDYAPLALQALSKVTGDKLEIAWMGGSWQASFGSLSLPMWQDAPILLLDFPGRPFPVFSYRDVLSGKVAATEFKDKLVIVGSTYDIADSFQVPRNPAGHIGQVPGCFVHATVADQLLGNHFIRFAPYPLEGSHASPWLMGYFWGALLSSLGVLAHYKSRLARALQLNAALFVGYFLFAGVALAIGGVYFNVVIPSFMLIVLQGPLVALELWQVRNLLRWFIPQSDVERMVRSGGSSTQSQSQLATVLFIDIRDYTTLSEKLADPSQVRQLVSQFHLVTATLFEQFGGYVCDFQGDAQMVAFGVAPADASHALKAVAAAAALPQAVARLNQEVSHEYPQLGLEGRDIFRYGVGICTGEVSVGYLQGGGKLQHTVLGDTTNTAARLQGLARDLGVITVVSHTTASLAPTFSERLRPLAAAKLKGKLEAHGIFELIP